MWFDLQRRDPDDQGPLVLRRELHLVAPPDAVFSLLVDEQELARWFPGLRRARWLTAAPHGIGSLRRRDLGAVRLIDHVVAWRPGRRLTTWVERATLPFARHLLEDLRLEPAHGGGTRLGWSLHLRPHRPLRPLVPALRLELGRLHAQAVRNLAMRAALDEAD